MVFGGGRGALFKGALFACIVAVATLVAAKAAARCSAEADSRARVAYVYDGDTVRLSDVRDVRLIGINAPALGREKRPTEPFAKEARTALQAALAEEAVHLAYGPERRDRHGRTLAHLYNAQGDNLQAELLAQGLAVVIAVPPNLGQRRCYQRAERRARDAGRGVGSLPAHRDPVMAKALLPDTDDAEGLRLIQGWVGRIGESRRHFWLDLAPKLTLRIAKEDLGYFQRPIGTYEDKRVVVRGWVYTDQGQLYMRVHHPAALTVLE